MKDRQALLCMTSYQFSIVTSLLMLSALSALFSLALGNIPAVGDGSAVSNSFFPNWIPDWPGTRIEVMVVGFFFVASMIPFLFSSRTNALVLYGIAAGANASTMMVEVRYSAFFALIGFLIAIYFVLINMDA